MLFDLSISLSLSLSLCVCVCVRPISDYTTTRERQEQSDASLAKKWESEGDLLQAALTTDPNTNKKKWRWRGAHKKPTKPQATLNGLPLPVPPDGLATQVEDVPENELEMVLSKLSFQTGQPYIEGQGYHAGKTAPATHTGGKGGKVGEDLAAKVLMKPRRKQAKLKTFSSLLGSLLDCLPCHALTARLGLDQDDVGDSAREAPFKPAAYSAASLLRLLSQAEQHADDLVQGAVAKKQAMQKRLKEEVDQEVAAYRCGKEGEREGGRGLQLWMSVCLSACFVCACAVQGCSREGVSAGTPGGK